MKLVVDIETDSLDVNKVENIWCIVCKDVDSSKVYVFEGLTNECKDLFKSATSVIGHNFIHFDYCVIERFAPGTIDPSKVVDTLVLSKLLKYSLDDGEGHSLEAWGFRFKCPKHPSPDFSQFSPEMLEYCKQDVDINHTLYNYLTSYLSGPEWTRPIETEMAMAWICLDMHLNGFKYDKVKADDLKKDLEQRLEALDKQIIDCFPPKLKAVREITPRLTKHGTISKANIPRSWTDYTKLHAGCPFVLVEHEWFNPSSSSQIVSRLNEAGWRPVEPTKTGKSFKINEVNLATLPEHAPEGARKLVERLLVAARVRTLTEWQKAAQRQLEIDVLNIDGTGQEIKEELIQSGMLKRSSGADDLILDPMVFFQKTLNEWLKSKKAYVLSVEKKENSSLITAILPEKLEDFSASDVTSVLDGLKRIEIKHAVTYRIRGKFNSIGTWPGRMSHNAPNMGNIATKKSIKYKGERLRSLATDLGATMRRLWISDEASWLVGTDMEAAHVRLFAHYIDDREFTRAVCSGNKKEETDIHSVGARLFSHLGCSRDNHKTFIFSFFNGAGPPKVAEIFGCSIEEARRALRLYQERFPGIRILREKLIPIYARQGWFPGLDGRQVIYTEEHGMFAGMLQSGEAIVMKMANILWRKKLNEQAISFRQVNLVHDEFVTEVPGQEASAKLVGQVQCDAIRDIGNYLDLRCPLAGEYKTGKDWLSVH